MKILVSWLRELVDVPGTPEEIAARMSVRGFAVESIEAHGTDDAVLDFEITANRPDAMSVVGMAREVAAAYDLPLKSPSLAPAGTPPGPDSRLPVAIDAPDLCPRYAGALLDVRIGASPEWMQTRLRAAGIRPISNIVDVTNYVLLERGHPLHAFDHAKLAGGQIQVRRAKTGERVTTLDGVARELTPEMVIIADIAAPVAIAGVMGGANSEVTAATTTIALESAYFNPLSIRRTSKALGLKTEGSMRFERGADPSAPVEALRRACALIEEIGAGTARGVIVDHVVVPIAPRVIHLRRGTLAGLLGATIPDDDVRRILAALGFEAVSNSLAEVLGNEYGDPADGWDVTVPTRRVDVLREVDLIEEVARHYGFDRIPVTFPRLTSAPPATDPRTTRARQLRGLLTGCGFSEAVTFGFIDPAAAAPFAHGETAVPIANPLSENFGVLRPSLVPGLATAVGRNRRREQRDIRLFEIGGRFGVESGERQVVACAWSGAAVAEHWSGGARDVDFFDLKGLVERIVTALGVTVSIEPADRAWLAAGRSAIATHGTAVLGAFGQLAPVVADAHGMPANDAVYVAELDLDAIETVRRRGDVQVEPLPRHPSITRDLSILVDDSLAAQAIRETVQAAAPPTLVRVREFDRYQGTGIPDGKVSISLRLTYRVADRTLTDTEVQQAMDAVLAQLHTRHGAVRR